MKCKELYLFELDVMADYSSKNDINSNHLDFKLREGVLEIISEVGRENWKVIVPHDSEKGDYYYSLNGGHLNYNTDFLFFSTEDELIEYVKINKNYKIKLFIMYYIDIVDILIELGCEVVVVDKYDNLLPPDNCIYVNDFLEIKEVIKV